MSGLGAGGIAAYRHEGNIKERVYIQWPEGERGLVGPFCVKANVKGALAMTPDSVTSLAVLGVDFSAAWSRLSTFAGALAPVVPVRAQWC